MSWDDRQFLGTNYVRHKYRRRRHGRNVDKCVRCGVKRRRETYDWVYQGGNSAFGPTTWTTSNPPCARRPGR